MVRVAVMGACGRMGSEVVRAVTAASDMEIVAAADIAFVGSDLSRVTGVQEIDIEIKGDLESMLEAKPDVIVDFAKPFQMENIRLAMRNKIVPIIGTTGLKSDEIAEIGRLTQENWIGAMIIPNFAIGAVLMMKFAAEAARHMPNVEIIELHHDKKLDAPSGTAIKTAEMIEAARHEAGVKWELPLGGDDPARGEERSGVQVHSIRLPGLVAHQEVIFGGIGQTLTIRHDSIDRTSFMPGVLLAIRRASTIKDLVYGLDKLL